jgi:pyruvate kinase
MSQPAVAPRPRRTKIVATLGPGSSAPKMLENLLLAGVNVVRINASHGDHATHATNIANVRQIAARLDLPVGVLLDLQGPKIRVGRFDHPPRQLAAGDQFAFAVNRPAQANELPADYPYLDRDVRVGQPLLIDDGNLACDVLEVEPGRVLCRARHAGSIAQRKGINLPQSQVSAPAISDKDRADALFGVAQQVDLIALSFVREAADIEELRALLLTAGSAIPIVSKIEKPQALVHLESIVAASWGVMVARGDLGVELSTADVPMAQKRIIREANRQCKPVITATQMLDSMTRNPRPTRAEASDVANAVLDGSDAVMLSQETATGDYPVETVQTMVQIIEAAENGDPAAGPGAVPRRWQQPWEGADIPEAVAFAGCEVARLLQARAIVVLTDTGRMALLAARLRPQAPIFAMARTPAVCNQLCLACNVSPHLAVGRGEPDGAPDKTADLSIDARVQEVDRWLSQRQFCQPGDVLVLLVGRPNAPTGSTNLLMIHRVGSKETAYSPPLTP